MWGFANEAAFIGRQLKALREDLPDIDSRVAAIYRQNRAILPKGDTVIESGDEVFFLAARQHIHSVMSELCRVERPGRRIMLTGAGNIGVRLAAALEQSNCTVKIVERDAQRAKEVSGQLDRSVVLHGDAADEELMHQENIDTVDVFLLIDQ